MTLENVSARYTAMIGCDRCAERRTLTNRQKPAEFTDKSPQSQSGEKLPTFIRSFREIANSMMRFFKIPVT